MKIVILAVGRTTTPWISAAVDEYLGRARRYLPVEMEIVADLKTTRNLSEQQQRERESAALVGALKVGDRVVVMDEHGTEPTSRGLSEMIEREMIQGTKRLVMVIGGPYGFGPDILARAERKIALSRMTFTHEMARLVLAEQIYRAMTIMRGEPYHHD